MELIIYLQQIVYKWVHLQLQSRYRLAVSGRFDSVPCIYFSSHIYVL
jgi:hypothetical protein